MGRKKRQEKGGERKRRGRKKSSKGICPRCGRPISWFKVEDRRGRKYVYAVHYEGTVKGRRVMETCYLGPLDGYVYCTITHGDLGLMFKSALDRDRALDYLEGLLDSVLSGVRSGRIPRERLLALKPSLLRLKEILDRLEEGGEG